VANLNKVKQANNSPYLEKVEAATVYDFNKSPETQQKQKKQLSNHFFKTSKQTFKNSQSIYRGPFTPKLNTSSENKTGPAQAVNLKKKKKAPNSPLREVKVSKEAEAREVA